MKRPLLFVAVLSGILSAQEPAKPVFQDGQAQIVKAFKKGWVQHDLWVETNFDSDGDGALDRMHVDVTRPGQTDTEGLKVPVIYQTSPYFSGTGGLDFDFFWSPEQEVGGEPKERPEPPPVVSNAKRPIISTGLIRTWVPRGFAVVHSESPGTGNSDGCPTVGGMNETLAPKFVIDWLCGRAKGFTEREGGDEVKAFWSTGRVGMTGVSYEGTLPLAAATTGVEGLEAIVPIAPNTSYYNYYRANGLVRAPGGYMGEDVDVLYNFIHSGEEAMRSWCDQNVREDDIEKNIDRVTGDWSDWWAARDLQKQLSKVRAATLCVHGFNDWNVMPSHSVNVYETLKEMGVPTMAFFHQGGHSHPSMMKWINRWFSHYLYGVDNGVEKDARAWIVREGERSKNATPYADYPNPDAQGVTLRLGPGVDGKPGKLGVLAGGGYETLVDDASKPGAELAKAETSPHRLMYVSPVLSEPVHLSGRTKVHIGLSCSKPSANLSVWLVSLPWTDSRSINDDVITRGWADPQNRGKLDESSPLVPGEEVVFSFDLEPDDQIIPAGEQIGLMIFSSDRDFTLWPEPGTELSVNLGKTYIELPVVGGNTAWTTATQ